MKHILIVEDDSVNATIQKTILRNIPNTTITIIKDSRNITKFIEVNRFDLAIVDIDMEYLDGFGVAFHLKNKGFACPIVAVTGHKESDFPKANIALFDGWYVKPVKHESYVKFICKYLCDIMCPKTNVSCGLSKFC